MGQGMGKSPVGLVFNVQRYSIHDGPGIRTTVFLKGCPLRCQWCHNPEAMSGRVEFGFFPDRCIACLECVQACPNGVHVVEDGRRAVRRELCRGEGKCADVCYAEAIERIGYPLTVEEALAQVERDRPFYETSRGGVTISGGEPLRQVEFSVALLEGAKARGLHTALDTCGYAPWCALAAAAEHADLVLYDLKHMGSAVHRELTGVPNDLILENLARVVELRGPDRVWVRYPFIPGLNDGSENVEAMGAFLGPLSGQGAWARLRVDILPYHQLGQSKYRKLGLGYPLEGQRAPERSEMEAAAVVLSAAGLEPHVGG
jgi:pyruvate formate lyase activating enzyme